MSRYENDYPDHQQAPDYAHGDERPSNHTNNPTIYDVLDASSSRRSFVLGSLTALAASFTGVSALTSPQALAQATTATQGGQSSKLGFKAIAINKDDKVTLPEGYRSQVLVPWGTPINGTSPAYQPGAVTGADQAQQMGSHHDGMNFFPLNGSSEEGILVINHEYVEPRLIHAVKWKGQALDNEAVVFDANGNRDADEVLAEINGHGLSIVRVKKMADGQWGLVDDKLNRRITGLTPMEISGPVRGSQYLITKYSPDGTKIRGTLNNCANGVTPWNTYMAAEENWSGYFVNHDKKDDKPNLPREQARYGVPSDKSRYGWEKAVGGADEYVRFDVSTKASSAAEDYRNEANQFGWMVEVNPFDPAATPVKRSALGRFAHEGVVFAPAVAGKPVVCYSGDDSRFEYVYKFVSAKPFDPATANGSLLDDGTLYVAKFKPDGTGEWLALTPGQNGLTPENGFANLVDILINTRLAADKAGATKMDRPEWGTVDPATGDVYFTFTNNNKRAQTQVDAANPRAENNFGQIIRWRYAGQDHSATNFQWEIFVLAGSKTSSLLANGKALPEEGIFACPDGLLCDAKSRLWIQTDMGDIGPPFSGPLAPFGTNQMLAADPDTGEIRRFLTGPWGQEITGISLTPDLKTMFINIQHPGAHATAEQFAAGDFGSAFPDYNGTLPRSTTLVITREDGGIIGA